MNGGTTSSRSFSIMLLTVDIFISSGRDASLPRSIPDNQNGLTRVASPGSAALVGVSALGQGKRRSDTDFQAAGVDHVGHSGQMVLLLRRHDEEEGCDAVLVGHLL